MSTYLLQQTRVVTTRLPLTVIAGCYDIMAMQGLPCDGESPATVVRKVITAFINSHIRGKHIPKYETDEQLQARLEKFLAQRMEMADVDLTTADFGPGTLEPNQATREEIASRLFGDDQRDAVSKEVEQTLQNKKEIPITPDDSPAEGSEDDATDGPGVLPWDGQEDSLLSMEEILQTASRKDEIIQQLKEGGEEYQQSNAPEIMAIRLAYTKYPRHQWGEEPVMKAIGRYLAQAASVLDDS